VAIVDRAVSPRRFVMTLLGAFSGAALLLASLGIYGVLSYSVSQRTKEFGIRMALGASAGTIRTHVVTRTLALTGLGLVLGWLGSLALSRAIASLLHGVAPSDPLTLVATTGLLIAVAALAAYLPARRASRVDPISALRTA
jgi:ABC-type antimicrobial peptide transport system permease subunit